VTSQTGRTGPVVRIRQDPDARIAAGIVGLVAGVVLVGVVAGIVAPLLPDLGSWWYLVFFLVWLLGGGAVAALSWRATGLRFEDDRLVVGRPTGLRHSVRWEHVRHVRVEDTTDTDNDRVISRWLVVDALPQRVVRLGVRMPDPGVDAHTRFGERRRATRRAVVDELEVRGFTVHEQGT
jgi:hypothetical protein